MNTISNLSLTLCYLSVAITVLSLFIPQKRTRKIFSFVIGLFIICSLISCFVDVSIDFDDLTPEDQTLSGIDHQDYNEAVKQETVNNLVSSIDELLRAQGIEANDIQLSLIISDAGRIYADDIVIYISEEDFGRKQDIERLIYTNLSKEPRIYVEKEVQSTDQK